MRKITKDSLFLFSAILIFVAGITIIVIQFVSPDPHIALLTGNYSDHSLSQIETKIWKNVSIVSISLKPGNAIIHFSGETNLPAGSAILYEILPSNLTQRKKTTEEITGSAGTTTCYQQNGSVIWSVTIGTDTWNTGGYIINAWPEQSDPRYGDRKSFFLPLNETVLNGAGTYAVSGEIVLNPLSLSETPANPVSVTPFLTPV